MERSWKLKPFTVVPAEAPSANTVIELPVPREGAGISLLVDYPGASGTTVVKANIFTNLEAAKRIAGQTSTFTTDNAAMAHAIANTDTKLVDYAATAWQTAGKGAKIDLPTTPYRNTDGGITNAKSRLYLVLLVTAGNKEYTISGSVNLSSVAVR